MSIELHPWKSNISRTRGSPAADSSVDVTTITSCEAVHTATVSNTWGAGVTVTLRKVNLLKHL